MGPIYAGSCNPTSWYTVRNACMSGCNGEVSVCLKPYFNTPCLPLSYVLSSPISLHSTEGPSGPLTGSGKNYPNLQFLSAGTGAVWLGHGRGKEGGWGGLTSDILYRSPMYT